jgi:hypothetical protein
MVITLAVIVPLLFAAAMAARRVVPVSPGAGLQLNAQENPKTP